MVLFNLRSVLQKKILVQDDDEDIREVIKSILDEVGFCVYTSKTIENLLTEINEFEPNVILLDFRMYGADCIKACERTKAQHPVLPVIAMSCNGNIHQLYQKYLFDDYLAKPFDIETLIGVVERCFDLGSKPLKYSD